MSNDTPSDDHVAPPPPPPPGGEAFIKPEAFRSQEDITDQPLESGKPAVAASPTRVFIVLGLMISLLLYLLYNIFFSGSEKKEDVTDRAKEIAGSNSRLGGPAPPPPIVDEEIPVPPRIEPPTIPEPTQLPEINQEDDEANNKALLDRLKSNMLVLNAGGGLFGDDRSDQAEEQLSALDANSQFGALVARSTTKAPKVTATQIGALARTIAQGRIIQATMETALNTDLPGPIRAIVSRDIYGEAGSEPLIPKGSRLIGQYNTNIVFGQSRVYVMWTRVIRPDGVDVALGSPLVDQIGQAGIGGVVDNKFRELFSRAVLASVFSIAVAAGIDSSGLDTNTTTTITTTGTQQSGTLAGQATVDALNRLGSVTTGFIQKFINVKPTIVVDQGTPVLVFVNRDVIFPADLVGARMIP